MSSVIETPTSTNVRGKLRTLFHESSLPLIVWSAPYTILAVAWVVYLFVSYYFATTTPLGLRAFYVYFEASEALVGGSSLYNGTTGWIYLYPPLVAQLLIPLTFSYQIAIIVWFGLNAGLLVLTLMLLARFIPVEKWLLLWLAPLVFIPFWQALYLGQVTIIMLALLTVIWVAVRVRRPHMAGMVLALATWIKVFPGLLILYFLWKRDWAVLRGVVIAGLGLLIFQVALSGPGEMLAFLETLVTLVSGGQPQATYENLSIFAFTSRLFQENTFVEPVYVDEMLFLVSRLVLTLGVFFIAMITIFRSNVDTRQPHTLGRLFDLEFGTVILTILLMGSTLWVSGLPPMLLVYVLILRHTESLLVKVLCGVSFLLLTLYQPFLVVFRGETLHALVLSTGFFGVILIWLVLVVPLLRAD